MATLHAPVIIAGGGPAGMTAAIYVARASLSPLVFLGETLGGQLGRSDDVEDFPGFVNGVSGRRLIELLLRQALRFGAEFRFERVTEIDLASHPFMLATPEHQVACDALILALGASSRSLGVPGEDRLRGRGVFNMALGHAASYPGRAAVVVGGGDGAAEAALYAARFASRVTVVHRRERLRASAILQQRLFDSDKIQFAWTSVVSEIIGDTAVEGVMIVDVDSGETREIRTDAVYVAIGQDPNSQLVRGQVETDGAGYIAVAPGTCQTSVDGVFACGELVDPSYRQAVTAAGTGCMASIDAERYLERAAIADLERGARRRRDAEAPAGG